MARVVHFEIPADQPERAIEFYTRVFGWKVQKWEGAEDYWVIITGEDSEPGINGGLMKRAAPFPNPVNSIEVASVDEYLEKVTGSGGKVISPKSPIPGVGYIAYFEDPEGNISGLFQTDRSVK